MSIRSIPGQPRNDEMAQDLPSSAEQLDIEAYIRTIRKNKWFILLFAALFTGLAAFYAFTATPFYRATATLLIESQKANILSIEEIYGIESSGSEYYQTQFEILKSRELAEKIVDNLDLVNHPEFDPRVKKSYVDNVKALFNIEAATDSAVNVSENSSDITDTTENDISLSLAIDDIEKLRRIVIMDFLSRLSIEPVRKTQLVKISFEASNADVAAEIANSVGNAYIEDYLESKLEMTAKASRWLTEQLTGLKAKLSDSEQKLISFQTKHGLVSLDGSVTEISARQLSEISTDMVDAQRRLNEANSLYSQIKRIGRNNNRQLEILPVVQQSQVVNTYKIERAQQQSELNELLNRYGSKHPKVVDARSRVNVIQQSINLEIQRIIASVEKDYEFAKQNHNLLIKTLDSSKDDARKITKLTFELAQLQREVDANRELYDTFFKRIRETDELAGLNATNARISDPAVSPLNASKPRKQIIIALALIASMAIALGISFFSEFMDKSIKSPDEIERKLGQRILGVIPLVKSGLFEGNKSSPLNPETMKDQQGVFNEAINTVRTNLTVSAATDEHNQIIMVTSSIPSEGKSSLSLNLAASFASMEKVLLIDADMRRPTLARSAEMDTEVAGLSDLIKRNNKAQECIYRKKIADIDILPAGHIPSNPLELLSSKRLGFILEQLRKHYDRILIACPPIHAVSDALIISRHADALIYAIKSHDTPFPTVRRGIERFTQLAAPIKGVVVTQFDVQKVSSYAGDHYYHGYYDYYGYAADSKKKTQKDRKSQKNIKAA